MSKWPINLKFIPSIEKSKIETHIADVHGADVPKIFLPVEEERKIPVQKIPVNKFDTTPKEILCEKCSDICKSEKEYKE